MSVSRVAHLLNWGTALGLKTPRLGVGGGGLSVEDGCLPLVHKSLLMYRQPTRRPGLFLGPTETLLDPLTFDVGLHALSVEPFTPAGFFTPNLCDVGSVVPDTRSAFFSNNHILGDSMVRCGVGVQVLDCAHCVAFFFFSKLRTSLFRKD